MKRPPPKFAPAHDFWNIQIIKIMKTSTNNYFSHKKTNIRDVKDIHVLYTFYSMDSRSWLINKKAIFVTENSKNSCKMIFKFHDVLMNFMFQTCAEADLGGGLGQNFRVIVGKIISIHLSFFNSWHKYRLYKTKLYSF